MGMTVEFTKLLDSLVIGYFGRQKYFLTAKSLLEESHSLGKKGPSNIEDTLHGANLEQIIETFQRSGDFRVPPFFTEFGVHLQQLTSEYFSYLVDHPANRSYSKNQRMLYGRNVSRRNTNSVFASSTLQNNPNHCHSPSSSPNAPLSASSSNVHVLTLPAISNAETQSASNTIYIAQLVDNNGIVADPTQQLSMEVPATVPGVSNLYENDNTPASTNNDSSGCQENVDTAQPSSINLTGECSGSTTTVVTAVEQRPDVVAIDDDGRDSSNCSKTSSSLEHHSLKRKSREPISLQQRLRHGLFAPDTVQRLAKAANTSAVASCGDCDNGDVPNDADSDGAHLSQKPDAFPPLEPTRSLLSCIDNTLEKYMNPDNVQDFLANFNFEDDNWFADVDDDISNDPLSFSFKDITDDTPQLSTDQVLLESLDMKGGTAAPAENHSKIDDFGDVKTLEADKARVCHSANGGNVGDAITNTSPVRRRRLVVIGVDDVSPPPPENTRVEIIDEDLPCGCRDCNVEAMVTIDKTTKRKTNNEANYQSSVLPLNSIRRHIAPDKRPPVATLPRQKQNQTPPTKRRRNETDCEWSLVPLSPIDPPRGNYDRYHQAVLGKLGRKSQKQNSFNGRIASNKNNEETRHNDSQRAEYRKRQDNVDHRIRSDHNRRNSSPGRQQRQTGNDSSRNSRSELNERRDSSYVEQRQGNNRSHLVDSFGEADRKMSKMSQFDDERRRRIRKETANGIFGGGKKPPLGYSVAGDGNKENELPASSSGTSESRELVRIKIGRTDSPFRLKITRPLCANAERLSAPRESIAVQTPTVARATNSAQACPMKVSTSTQV